MKPSIKFFNSETTFLLPGKRKIKSWILSSLKKENRLPGEINFIFCSDTHLHQLNLKFLNHNTLTDIITFDSSENKTVSGEIYISIHRVKENALKFKQDFYKELHRVMIHGVLHLCGYKDKSPSEKKLMRSKEEFYLKVFRNENILVCYSVLV